MDQEKDYPKTGGSNLFDRITNTAPCGLYEYSLSSDGVEKFHYLNKKALEIFEIKQDEISQFATMIWQMFESSDIERIAQINNEAIKTCTPFYLEAPIQTRANTKKWIRMSSLPSESFHNGARIWSGYILDISHEKELTQKTIKQQIDLSIADKQLVHIGELEKINQELEKTLEERNSLLKSTAAYAKANKMGSLISTLTHEINNPLGAIGVSSQSLELEILEMRSYGITDKTLENLQSIADSIIKSNRRVAKTISNLRSLFVSGDNNSKNFDLSQTVDEITEILEPNIKKHRVRVSKEIEPLIFMRGDQGQLQMVFLNAINNAIDALIESTKEREINIKLYTQKDRIQFEVKDNGTGFKNDFLKKAFELFQTTKSKGMGVGLWLSRAIIENHNGTITATNNPDGIGATIKIVLRRIDHSTEI